MDIQDGKMEVIKYCVDNRDSIQRYVGRHGHIAAIKALRSMFDESGHRKPTVDDEFTGTPAPEARSHLSLFNAKHLIDLATER